jgi:dihydrolipoamide dehydrogenase
MSPPSASAQLGLKTAIVEREHLGRHLPRTGAAFRRRRFCARRKCMHFAKHAKNYGLKHRRHHQRRSSRRSSTARAASAERLNGGVGFLMKKNKIDVIWGEAKLTKRGQDHRRQDHRKNPWNRNPRSPKGVLGEGDYSAKHIIVATGARPRALPGIEPDGKLIWTYFEAMVPKEDAEDRSSSWAPARSASNLQRSTIRWVST